MPPHDQDEAQTASLRDPESFWSHQADQLHWHKKPSRSLKKSTKKLASGVEHSTYSWFPDGEISTSYNCVDRHVRNGNGDSTAIIWDSPVTGSKQRYTYKQLLLEVETLAGVLREEGVKKGDVVLVYSAFQASTRLWQVLIVDSANDTCCALCHPRNITPRRYTHRRVWRLCAGIPSSTD